MTTTITDTQRAILEAAAERPDGLVMPPAHLPPGPRGAVAKALLKAGLVGPAGAAAGGDEDLAWKVDGEAVLLRLTEVGRRAIGAGSETAPQAAEEAPPAPSGDPAPRGTQDAAHAGQRAPEGRGDGSSADAAEPPEDAPAAAQDGVQAAPATDVPGATPPASTAPTARASGLRAAARVLAAWDDAAGGRAGLAEAIEALRAALPPARPARAPRTEGAARVPRAGTKQEAVLALLRRPEGASGPDIAAATGWAPHTVRGFLAGLKKRGVQVLVHERVRQVGPGREGAKGSFTVYRVDAEPAA